MFLDILLSACSGIEKEVYLQGSFNTNHVVNPHQKTILRQARLALWEAMHSNTPIKNITIKNSEYLYLANESFDHRLQIFKNDFPSRKDLPVYFELTHQHMWKVNSFISFQESSGDKKQANSVRFVNTILTNTNLQIDDNVNILNCQFEDCDVNIGKNCHLTDINMVMKYIFSLKKILLNIISITNTKKTKLSLDIPANLFIQNVNINIECLDTTVNLNVVFGVTDNLTAVFDRTNWKIMNQNWNEFSEKTNIIEDDLWSSNIKSDARNLMNAKLYTVVNTHMDSEKMSLLNEFFWIEIFNCKKKEDLADK